MSLSDAKIFRFRGFIIDINNRDLLRRGKTVALASKPFDILTLLVESAPKLVRKNQFVADIWDGDAICDSTLTQHVSRIRKALRQKGSAGPFIETVNGHGYKFIAPLHVIQAGDIQRRYTKRPPKVTARGGKRVIALNDLAYSSCLAGKISEARGYLREGLRMVKASLPSGTLCALLETTAVIEHHLRRQERAAILLTCSEKIRQEPGADLEVGTQEKWKAVLRKIESGMTPEEFARVRERGRAMGLEKAIEFALEEGCA